MGRALTATVKEARANAELIVKAVNCFDELVAALHKALGVIDTYAMVDREGYHLVREARAALAKAEAP